MDTIHIRKARAGSTSGGRVWKHDGDVLELPYQEAVELLAIPDGGFTSVNPPHEQLTPYPTVTTDPAGTADQEAAGNGPGLAGDETSALPAGETPDETSPAGGEPADTGAASASTAGSRRRTSK